MSVKRKSAESPFILPDVFRFFIQPISQSFLRWLIHYQVRVQGDYPESPAIIAAYPHGVHLDSMILSPRKTVYLAAGDTFYSKRGLGGFWDRFSREMLLNTIPIVRINPTEEDHEQTKLLEQYILTIMRSNLVIYPQGTRSGKAENPDTLAAILKPGFISKAKLHNVPIYPVGFHRPNVDYPNKNIVGTKQLLTGVLPFSKKQQVVARIGKPIDVSDLAVHVKSEKVRVAHEFAEVVYKLAHASNEEIIPLLNSTNPEQR